LGEVPDEIREEHDTSGEDGYENDFVGVIGGGIKIAGDLAAKLFNPFGDCVSVEEYFVDVSVHGFYGIAPGA